MKKETDSYDKIFLKNSKLWKTQNIKKRDKIIGDLKKKGKNIEDIINFFSYDNLKIAKEDYCPLFRSNKKCHNIKNLNCYGCYCPNYKIEIFEDGNKKFFGNCTINSNKKTWHKKDENNFVLDCSNCTIPHQYIEIEKIINLTYNKF